MRLETRLSFIAPAAVALLLTGCAGDSPEEASDATSTRAAAAPAEVAGARSPADEQVPPEVQALVAEYHELREALGAIEQSVQGDPDIQAEQRAFVASVEAKMQGIDPGSNDRLAEHDRLQAEARAASDAGDQEKLQALVARIRELEGPLGDARSQAMRDPELVEQLERLRARVQVAMERADSNTPLLIERFREVEAQLRAASAATARAPTD